MARYDDYVKENEENLEQEINEAGEAQAERATSDVPESVLKRFEGKTQAEVLESYANLERKLSEQGQTMGELRRSFDDYVLLQSQPSEPEPAPEPVTADDLYEDPENAVARVVKKETGDKLKSLEDELQLVRRERSLSEFERKFPEARGQAQTPEFLEWVQGSPYRKRLAVQADAYDFDAAEQLFGLYEDSTSSQAAAAETVQREQDLRNAGLESASPESPTSDEVFSRAEIIDWKLRAKLGDREAQTYLAKNGNSIALAYEEGRVVD